MGGEKPTDKQILDAYGKSYRLMQDAKKYQDIIFQVIATRTL
jgi:hypothetical protein